MEFIIHASGSSGNLYQVISQDRSILIDPGIPIKKIKQALKFKLSAVSACLATHRDGDHSKGIHEVAKAGIDCYMTHDTSQALNMNGHRTHIIEPLKQFKADGFTILAFPTFHDCPGSVGFLIADQQGEKLLFITDSQFVHHKFSGLTKIAIEANWSEQTMAPDLDQAVKKRIYNTHMSLDAVKKFLAANDLSKVEAIYLVHISQGNGDPELFRSEVARATGKPVYI